MTREELNKMIEDEVAAAIGNTMEEPAPEPQTDPSKLIPQKTTAGLTSEELDDIMFYGGEKPTDE